MFNALHVAVNSLVDDKIPANTVEMLISQSLQYDLHLETWRKNKETNIPHYGTSNSRSHYRRRQRYTSQIHLLPQPFPTILTTPI